MCRLPMLFCATFALLQGEIRTIETITHIEEWLSPSLSSADWILFDIDYTLTVPDHPLLQKAVIAAHKTRYKEELSRFSKKQRASLPILMVTHAPSRLLDPSAPLLIQKLQKRGATVLGFTAADTSSLPGIGAVPNWRRDELKRLGITFSQLPIPPSTFRHFPPFRGTYPLYQEGVLFSNVTTSKGKALGALLDITQEKPSKILLIDDTKENLESTQEELAERHIPFLGLYYHPKQEPQEASESAWRALWDALYQRAEAVFPSN